MFLPERRTVTDQRLSAGSHTVHRAGPANPAEVTAGGYWQLLVRLRELTAVIMRDCSPALRTFQAL
jgi:hypothetical protein